MLELTDIALQRGSKQVLAGISAAFKAGSLTAIIGPNGAGKTSLLKTAAGLLSPDAGTVTLAEGDFADPRQRARAIAYMPQFQRVAWPLLARDVAALGLLPMGLRDAALVHKALESCHAAQFADRPIDTLSGGEQARVYLARLLVGRALVLLLDEPVQSLDAAGALAVMHVLRGAANDGAAVGLVLHDFNLAAKFCDQVIVLDQGRVAAQGKPADLLSPARLAPIFKVEFDAATGDAGTYLVPLRNRGSRAFEQRNLEKLNEPTAD